MITTQHIDRIDRAYRIDHIGYTGAGCRSINRNTISLYGNDSSSKKKPIIALFVCTSICISICLFDSLFDSLFGCLAVCRCFDLNQPKSLPHLSDPILPKLPYRRHDLNTLTASCFPPHHSVLLKPKINLLFTSERVQCFTCFDFHYRSNLFTCKDCTQSFRLGAGHAYISFRCLLLLSKATSCRFKFGLAPSLSRLRGFLLAYMGNYSKSGFGRQPICNIYLKKIHKSLGDMRLHPQIVIRDSQKKHDLWFFKNGVF